MNPLKILLGPEKIVEFTHPPESPHLDPTLLAKRVHSPQATTKSLDQLE